MLFIEAPAGVGFSYCDTSSEAERIECAQWTDRKYTAYNLALLDKFYEQYPDMRAAPLWVAGESYAGIVATLLSEAIVRENNSTTANRTLNLAGVLHGNGAVG